MTIQVANLGIVDLGKTVVKRKTITIPVGIPSLANKTTSTVGIDINNLNIYNRTILLEEQVIHIIKREIQPTVNTIIISYYKKMFNLLFKENSIFKLVVLASPCLV